MAIPISYLLISLLLTAIPVNQTRDQTDRETSIFLSTNGVHLDIVIPRQNVDSVLLLGLAIEASTNYLAFGWGDENFYLHTPTWSDLTLGNAVRAILLKSSTLMHLTRYRGQQANWTEVKVSEAELRQLNAYLLASFQTDHNGQKILLPGQGYSSSDDFYKAVGSYSCLRTCNSWVNTGFRQSGLKACLWTPFDFGLLNKYN